MKPLIYGSVCSGIEAATAAWDPLGWKPAFFSEIEQAPRDVLAYRWPDVPIHGDFTTIKRGDYAPIQLLVGGTPCQDFSVAGLRKGLAGDRGNLTLEFVRLLGRLRPQWFVWENVPGVLSQDKGRAFGAFLGGVAECGYGFAYRVLDAQFYGVAQRRRRVFVVGYLGNWRPPAAVLFDGESLSGNPAPRRETGQSVTYDVAPSLTASGRGVERSGETRGQDPVVAVAPTLDGRSGRSGVNNFATSGGLVPETAHTLRGEGFDASEDGSGRGTPIIPLLEVNGRGAEGSEQDGLGIGNESDPMFTLQAGKQHGVFRMQAFGQYEEDDAASALKSRDYKDATDLVAFDCKGSQAQVYKDGVTGTLRSMNNDKSNISGGGQVAVAYDLQQVTSKTNRSNPKAGDPAGTLHVNAAPAVAFETRIARNGRGKPSEVVPALKAQSGRSGKGDSAPIAIAPQGGVSRASIRRLTPRECERLQGLPDDYTLTPIALKKRQTRQRWQSDSSRYKMIGNSMAVPVMFKIGERIELVRKLMKEK